MKQMRRWRICSVGPANWIGRGEPKVPQRRLADFARKGAPQSRMALWGEEEQGSGRSFRRQAETELSGLCDDEVLGYAA